MLEIFLVNHLFDFHLVWWRVVIGDMLLHQPLSGRQVGEGRAIDGMVSHDVL